MPSESAPRLSASQLLLRQVTQQKLTPQQQLEALRRVQAQAEQRVQLGLKLFEAAEGKLIAQTEAAVQVRKAQQELHDRIDEEVSRSLRSYDQWIGQVEDKVTKAIETLDQRIGSLERRWRASEAQLSRLTSQVQNLLNRAQQSIEAADFKGEPGGASPRPGRSYPQPPRASADPAAASTQRPTRPRASSPGGNSESTANDSPDHPPAGSEDQAWQEVYHRALLWLGDSATEKRDHIDDVDQSDQNDHPPRAAAG